MPIKCSNCGKQAEKDEKFCTTCGSSLREPTNSAPKPENGSLQAVLGAGVICLCIFGAYYLLSILPGQEAARKEEASAALTQEAAQASAAAAYKADQLQKLQSCLSDVNKIMSDFLSERYPNGTTDRQTEQVLVLMKQMKDECATRFPIQ